MSYTQLDPTDFVISSDSITAPAWSNNLPVLATFVTASTGISSSYYLDVYNTGSSNVNSAVQFSIAYGHITGTGSLALNSLIPGITPTRINFGQYRNLIYGDPTATFNFGALTTASSNIFAISIDRSRYKESLMPGTFNLGLSNGGSTIYLTDDSNDATTINYLDCGRVFNIISGSYGSATGVPIPIGASKSGYTASGSYGLYLPDIGTIILNPNALTLPFANGGIGLSLYSGTSLQSNAASSSLNNIALFNSISASANFQLLSQETISSNYIFVRVKNAQYNYSTNPSFVSGSGTLLYSNFINNPQTYYTTIGFYNQNTDLVAVAKMSRPLVKDFTKEGLVTVKLDW